MKFQMKAAFVGAITAVAALSANATIATVFNSIPAGTASFITTVTNAGAIAASDRLTGMSSGATISRPVSATSPNAYTISAGDGFAGVTGYGTMTGQVIDISPSGSGTNPINYRNSGLEFSFTTPINSIGFEVGDWGTCCQPSALYISFDNGAPIRVGLSSVGGDVFFGGRAEVFVAAFDDSGTFSKVQFWGDGVGEFLVAGGTVRYATLDQGSLPGVPEPGTAALVGLAFLAAGVARRRRQA